MSDRIQQLLDFLKEDPNDPFTLYALAKEYEKNDATSALQYYEKLLNEHAGYLPTYYQAGKFLESLQRFEEAEKVYLNGIELAKKLGNNKTRGELQSALDLM